MTTGIVKWFNPDKGFGFIESEGVDDLFVHASALPYGETLAEGDSVEFSAERSDRGMNAVSVRVIERSGVSPQRRSAAGDTRSANSGQTVDPSGLPLIQGTVARFDIEKGFGFIQPDDRHDQVFFHKSVAPPRLASGDRVEFRLGSGPKGPRAEQVSQV